MIGQIAYTPKTRLTLTSGIKTRDISPNHGPSNPKKMQPKTQIDLFQGWPATAMLPTQRLKQAANDVLSNKSIFNDGLAYGPDEGYYPLRKNIASWLSQSYTPLHTINAERISITGGASQNLACILQVFTEPAQTQRIWLVEPCYHLVFRVFEDAGFSGRMVGIPEDEGGMDVTALELALSEFESSENASQSNQVCFFFHGWKSWVWA
jgi:DNA-binding transcriptional MocR family regulator